MPTVKMNSSPAPVAKSQSQAPNLLDFDFSAPAAVPAQQNNASAVAWNAFASSSQQSMRVLSYMIF
jgi:hypothetical protein